MCPAVNRGRFIDNVGSSPTYAAKRGGMFQGGETALQADCGRFDSVPLHKTYGTQANLVKAPG
jgi:hypothetical protein